MYQTDASYLVFMSHFTPTTFIWPYLQWKEFSISEICLERP